jgi:Flp pilus assembly protein TadD
MMRQKKRPTKDPIEGFSPLSERRAWLFALFLLSVTFMAYQPVWHAGFIWDDDTFLTDNPVIKSASGLYRLWFTASTPDYFPMTSSMLWLEWRIWAMHPLGYHLVNVLLHALSAVLLWRVLQRLKIPGAMLAAAFFALHPVNVESVAWITERKNTLAMFFYLGAILSWVRFDDSGKGRWYGLALAGFALALLSKTAVAPLPLVLLGIIWWRRGRVGWKDVRQLVPFFVMAAVLGLVTIWFQSHRAIGSEVVRTDGFWSRLAGAGWAVWFYLYKALLPLKLIFVYPRWQIDARNVLSYLPLVLLVAGFVLCWRFGRQWGKALCFGLGYFVVMLLPVLGFINIYFMDYSLVSDHWQYFAIIGPLVLAAAGVKTMLAAVTGGNKWVRGVGCAALLVGLGALTWQQCGIYANSETLWQTTLRLNPTSWMVHNNLGYDLLFRKGRVNEAMTHFEKSLELKPDDAEAHNNLGVCLSREGRMDDAVSQFEKALGIKPDYPQAHNDLGLSFSILGRKDEAISQFKKALEIQPDYPDACFNLGNTFGQLGRTGEAILQYKKALELKPDFLAARMNLGDSLSRMGRIDEGIAQIQKAVELDPDDAEARYNLGNILFQAGRTGEAVVQFQRAVELKPDDADAQSNLGGCYLQLGRVTDAITHYRKVLELKPASAEAQNNLGFSFFLLGHMDEAILHYQKALQIKPEYADAEKNLAWVLATCPQAGLRDGNRALQLARRANDLVGGKNPSFLRTLAAAYAEVGQFGDARQSAQQALELARAAGRQDMVENLAGELKRYEAGLPCHQ